MTTFLGSQISGLEISDGGIVFLQNEAPAITLSTDSTTIDLGSYSLDNLGSFLNDLNLGNKKITNVANPTQNQDVATKAYVDQALINEVESGIQSQSGTTKIQVTDESSQSIFTNNEINTMTITQTSIQPKVVVDMGGLNKIINVVDPTNAQDVGTKQYIDSKTINTLSVQTADYSTQGFKITGLGDALIGTDALNKQTADNRYYLNNTPLNDLLVPSGNLDLNNKKIINMAPALNLTDAMSIQDSLRYQWKYIGISAELVNNGFTNEYVIPFDQEISPPSNSLDSYIIYNNLEQSITFDTGHYYEISILFETAYQTANHTSTVLQLCNFHDNSVIKSFKTNRALELESSQITQFKTFIDTSLAGKMIIVKLDQIADHIQSIGANTHILIKTLY